MDLDVGIVDGGADSFEGVGASDGAKDANQGTFLGGRSLRQAGFDLSDAGSGIRCLYADRAQGLLGCIQILGAVCAGQQIEQAW